NGSESSTESVRNAFIAIPTPTPTATATPTPPPSPAPTATATPPPIPTPTPSPAPAAQALNLSTRMLVQTGAEVGIGGFIVTGSAPKRVILRAIGPSLPISGALADPVLEGLNDNWMDDPAQKALIIATGIPPT